MVLQGRTASRGDSGGDAKCKCRDGFAEGVFCIVGKEEDAVLTGEDYKTPVDYWMPFYEGVGSMMPIRGALLTAGIFICGAVRTDASIRRRHRPPSFSRM